MTVSFLRKHRLAELADLGGALFLGRQNVEGDEQPQDKVLEVYYHVFGGAHGAFSDFEILQPLQNAVEQAVLILVNAVQQILQPFGRGNVDVHRSARHLFHQTVKHPQQFVEIGLKIRSELGDAVNQLWHNHHDDQRDYAKQGQEGQRK